MSTATGQKIYGWSRAWHLQEADARDVVQMVLAKLAVQLRRFAHDPPQSFRGWLRTVVRNAYRAWCSEVLTARPLTPTLSPLLGERATAVLERFGCAPGRRQT